MGGCLDRIDEHSNAQRARFDTLCLVQDMVIRNLQTLAESSQCLSSEIKATEPQTPWRELADVRSVIVCGCRGVNLGAVWLVGDLDLPPLFEAVNRMTTSHGLR
jgi:uncharacterized protein with HEPN domain